MHSIHIPVSADRYFTRLFDSSIFNWRSILTLLYPLILGNLFANLIAMLSAALISQNGEAAVAAVSLANPLCAVVINIFCGIITSGSVVISQSYGRNDQNALMKSIGMTMWMPTLVCIVMVLPVLLFPVQLLTLLYPQAEPLVLEYACTYLIGSMISTVFYAITCAAMTISRSIGLTKYNMILNILINILHLGFSVLFINILKLDILGCTLALLAARLVCCGIGLYIVFRKIPLLSSGCRQLFRFDSAIFRIMVKIASPICVDFLLTGICNILISMFLVLLGTTAMTINSIANQLIVLLYAPGYAAVDLAGILVGRCIGARKHDEAYRYGTRCTFIFMALILLTSLVFFPLLPLILSIFRPSEEVFSMTVKLLLASLPSLLLFFSCSYTLKSTVQAGGDTTFSASVFIFTAFAFNAGLGYLLSIVCGMGLWGVWIGCWAGWAVDTLLMYLRYRSKIWLNKINIGKETLN